MKNFNVKIPVWTDINVVVEASNKVEAEAKALSIAIEKHPLVTWEVDEQREYETKELE